MNAPAPSIILAQEPDVTTLLESMAVAFFALDHDWRFTYVNREAEELLSRSRASLLGRIIWEEYPDAVGGTYGLEYRRAVTERVPIAFGEFFPANMAWFEVCAYPSDTGLAVYFHNVTARRRAEEALRESESRFRQMADFLPQLIWTAKPDGGLDYYSKRWYDYTGLTFEQSRDWGWTQVVYEDDLLPARDAWLHSLNTGTPLEIEFRIRHADGAYHWHLCAAEAVRDSQGKVTQWVGTCTDITARKEAEVARESLYARDHTIATQLQEALQPALPGRTPGLALAKHYEPALPEAGVGGDFFDVFAAEKGVTFLVVGDLSGKGLAAAAQVATVRNMLRFALYNGRTLAGPVSSLNRTLAENQLLTGFATLFVGRYDSAARTLTYVNCGQEPGLVRRASSGQCEELEPTGPVLGATEYGTYIEQTVRLSPGDTVALFTDGLTEAGPSRTAMLGMDGVTALLAQEADVARGGGAQEQSEEIVRRLIGSIDAYSQNGVRDDICLLVGIVEGAAPGV